jgi:hypothetical protein
MAAVKPLAIKLDNKTKSNSVYAYITGKDINKGNALCFIQPDGQAFYPTSPGAPNSPFAMNNTVIPLNAPGQDKAVQIPVHITGGRIWFALDAPMTFLLNPGPELVCDSFHMFPELI